MHGPVVNWVSEFIFVRLKNRQHSFNCPSTNNTKTKLNVQSHTKLQKNHKNRFDATQREPWKTWHMFHLLNKTIEKSDKTLRSVGPPLACKGHKNCSRAGHVVLERVEAVRAQ